MNESIQPIRYVPQINKLDPKGRAGDKKGGKEKEGDFARNMSAKNEGAEKKAHSQVKEQNKDTKHQKQEIRKPIFEAFQHR